MRKEIYLDNLPRWECDGILKDKINWRESIGYKIKGVYNGLEFEIEIIAYDSDIVSINYNNDIHKIRPNDIKKCSLGRILGVVTKDFKVEIGQTIKDDKRDLIVTDRKTKQIKRKDGRFENKKYYRYKCNKCGFNCGKHWSTNDKKYKDEHWIEESNLINGKGCVCCCHNSQAIVEGINDISTTNPELVKYFKYPKEAKIYSKGTHTKIRVICQDCKQEKDISISNLCWQGLSCSCGDGKSYGEKFVMNVFTQLNAKFETEYSPDWANKKRYDFYFNYNGEEFLCEVHGLQHYEENTNFKMSLEDQWKNDKYKKELAFNNKIKEKNYIVIDARYSNLEWIKSNISKSRLRDLFDLSKINWIEAGELACSNIVKIASDIKNKNPDFTTKQIADIVGVDRNTIRVYLKQGTKLGWCYYNPIEETDKSKRKINRGGKQVEIFKENVSLGVFPSCNEIERQSEKLFGIKLNNQSVSAVCLGRRKTYKGYIFKYIK